MNTAQDIKQCELCENDFTPSDLNGSPHPRQRYCSIRCERYSQFLKNYQNPEWRFKKLISAAKNRAKVKHLPFDLDIEFIMTLWEENMECCALTGQQFDLSKWGQKGQVNPHAPSIDRIEPNKGYIKSNVRLITYHMNVALTEFGEEQFTQLARAYLAEQV